MRNRATSGLAADQTALHLVTALLAFAAIAGAQDNYLLGPDDQIALSVLDVQEFADPAPVKVDPRGYLTLPLVGQVKAAGLTTDELEIELIRQLRKLVKDPHVKVRVAEYRASPVSVLGAVHQSGVQQIRGRRTLYEVLSQAGGFRPDAGDVITVTRAKSAGALPLPNVRADETGQYQIAEVNTRELLSARQPLANIVLMPNDVVSVPRAELVYVMGNVIKSGGFVLDSGGSVSLLEALAMAGGPARFANLGGASVLRLTPATKERQVIPVDLGKVLTGKAEDVRLRAEDVLYIPHSTSKATVARALEAAAAIGSGVAIWRIGTRP